MTRDNQPDDKSQGAKRAPASTEHDRHAAAADKGSKSGAATQSEQKEGAPPQKSHRGFAAMDESRQRDIASAGGRAAHEKGTAHEFDSEEARIAGRKGGEVVSENREHMAEIGRKGGEARQQAASASRAQDKSRASESGKQPESGQGSKSGSQQKER